MTARRKRTHRGAVRRHADGFTLIELLEVGANIFSSLAKLGEVFVSLMFVQCRISHQEGKRPLPPLRDALLMKLSRVHPVSAVERVLVIGPFRR